MVEYIKIPLNNSAQQQNYQLHIYHKFIKSPSLIFDASRSRLYVGPRRRGKKKNEKMKIEKLIFYCKCY